MQRKNPVKIAWTPCLPQDGDLKWHRKPTSFNTEHLANEAARQFYLEHRYRERVVYCDSCAAFHLAHVYAADVLKGTAMSTPQIPQQALVPAPVTKLVEQEVPKPQPEPEQPTQAVLDAPTSLSEWLAEAKRLAASSRSINLTIGDHILSGKRTFGDAAVKEARKATGWTHAFTWLVTAVCTRFPVEKRVDGLSFHVYQRLRFFPDEITAPILKRAAAEGLGARTCYDIAVQMNGGADPATRLKKDCLVHIPRDLYVKVKQRTSGKIDAIVRQLLEEWLVGAPLTRQDSGQRTDAWRRAVAVAS